MVQTQRHLVLVWLVVFVFRFRGRPCFKSPTWLRGVAGYHICLTYGRTQEVPGSNPGAITFLPLFLIPGISPIPAPAS